MRAVAIVQARMGSSRLPGKVLRELAGVSVLAHVVKRAQAASRVASVVVATTDLPADDAVAAEAERLGAGVFRGSETDVLARYVGAAREASAEVVVRLTADCPLLDPALLDAMLAEFAWRRAAGERVDFMSNDLEPSYPRGLDVEIVPFEVLEAAAREAVAPEEREHVMPFIYRRPERFRLVSVRQARDCSFHRWTLDTPEDWALISAIVAGLGPDGRLFGMEEVLAWLEARPELVALNAEVKQKSVGGAS